MVAAIALAIALAIVEMLVSGWAFFKARDTVWESLEQSAEMQARGLAGAISDDLAARNYGAMESRIRQTMTNPAIRSALVTDMSGKVLSHQRRANEQLEPKLVFDSPPVLPPADADKRRYDTREDDPQVTRWARVDAGRQLGWTQIKMSTTETVASLKRLQQETFLLAVIGIVTGVTMLFYVLSTIFSQVRANEALVLADQKLLENEAHHDHLTGLANRYLLVDRMRQSMSRCLRHEDHMAVCLLDLDGFKSINDRMGHAAGDVLLIEVAHRLEACVRAGDTVARLGGDEFVLLLEQTQTSQACELLLQRVLESLHQAFFIHDQKVYVGASIGVTYYPHHGADDRDSATLLVEADRAMYESKRAGRHRWTAYGVPRQKQPPPPPSDPQPDP
jgi:diguanylate cyclase (GGDEF)-like protein